MDGGRVMSVDEVMAIVEDNGHNVTLSGGDPLYQFEAIEPLCIALRDAGYTIWLYTGFTFEQIYRHPTLSRVLQLVDVIVDGPFIERLRDTALFFRGSSNQRIIDVTASLAQGSPSIITRYP